MEEKEYEGPLTPILSSKDLLIRPYQGSGLLSVGKSQLTATKPQGSSFLSVGPSQRLTYVRKFLLFIIVFTEINDATDASDS
jgi:hypothetical protein